MIVLPEGCTAMPSASSSARTTASTCSISTVTTSTSLASSRILTGSVNEPVTALPHTAPIGESRPPGSSVVMITPRREAACAIMRPSWPPPRQPTWR